MHDGLDMPAPVNTSVYAGVSGKVIYRNDSYDPTFFPGTTIPIGHYHNGLLVLLGNTISPPVLNVLQGGGNVIPQQGGAYAIWFTHMIPEPQFTINATVSPSMEIGIIAQPPPGLQAHLHYSWHYQVPGGPLDSTMRNNLQGNPILMLPGRNLDQYKPEINDIKYRSQSGEGDLDPPYFNKRTASGKMVVARETDIVARATEHFCNFIPAYPLPPTRVEFSVRGYLPNESIGIPLQTPIDFREKFLKDYITTFNTTLENTQDKFFDNTITHIFYENDATCGSKPRKLLPDATDIFWFILTNVTGSTPKNNAPFYSWHTKALAGTNWNVHQQAISSTNSADSNKNAHFPDGRYIVRVQAWGYGNGLDSTAREDTIFINNHDESLYSCDSQGTTIDSFCIGRPVYVHGAGYPRNRQFRVYLLKHRQTGANDNRPLTGNDLTDSAIVQSNNEGVIQVTKIWNAYQPNLKSGVDSGYDVILDYDDDKWFTNKKGLQPNNVFTVDVKEDPLSRFSIISALPLKIDTIIVLAAKCKDTIKCNGMALFLVSGGRKPYTFLLGNKEDKNPIDSLCAGQKYKVRIKDANGCFIDTAVTIPADSSLLEITCSADADASCSICDGAASVEVNGGTEPYTFWWDGGPGDSTISGLCAGNHVVIVTDSNGCIDTCTVTIGRNDSGFDISCSKTDATCGKCNGTATATGSGGTPPYTYLWTGGRTGSTITNLCPGTYHCIASDSNGCTDTCTVVIQNGVSNLTASCSKTDNTSCNPCNGTATITASGGTPPYSYSWPGGTLTGLCPGTYTGTVTDANGCTASCAVTIGGASSGLTATCSSTASGCDSCNGTATITASGGTPPYTYSWPGGTLSGLCPGSYVGTVTDANGCTATCTAVVGKKIIKPGCLEDTTVSPPLTRRAPGGGPQLSIDRVYPNPFSEEVYIDFYTPVAGEALITVGNEIGQTEQTTRIAVDKGHNTIRIDGRTLAKGLHFVRLTIAGSMVIKVLRL